eukprot:m.279102 g.279102  ORF g.279102 m.279102 type:complete len:323 (-) comp15739_c4_seq9:3172-4140(-)
MSAGPKSPIRSAWVIAVCIICYTFTLAFGPAPTVSSNIVRHQGTDKEHLVLNELDDCVDLWTRTPQTSTVCIKRQHLTALFGGQEGHAHGLNTMFVNESGSRIDVSGTAGDIDIDWAAIHAKCERPSVLWDAPLDGGLTAGLATEAVSLISSIAPNVTLHFPEHMNVDTDFVDELPYQHQRLLKRIKAQSYAPSRPPPAIYVSQWAPGSLFRTKLDQARSPSEAMFIVSRAMYEATRVPTDWIPNFSLIHEYWVSRLLFRHKLAPLIMSSLCYDLVGNHILSVQNSFASRSPCYYAYQTSFQRRLNAHTCFPVNLISSILVH